MEMWRFRAVRAGRCALVWGRVGPPDGGHGVSAPAGGLSSGMHPPFSFPSCGKENGPCTVQKKRPLGRAPVQWPSARGGVRCGFDSGFPRRGCRRQRGARTHLTSSSFRAFRSAMRCPGGRGGCTGGRMRASAPTLGVAHLHGPTHRSAPAKHTRPSASP